MKKIYSLIALAAIAISANAEGRQKAVLNEPIVVKEPTATAVISLEGVKTNKVARATAKDFEGSYILSGISLTDGKTLSYELTVTLDNALSNNVTISGFPQNFKVKGTIDPEEETLSIANNQNLGADSYGDINYFYFKSFNSDGTALEDGASSIDESVATYVNGSFTFPPYEIWAIGDPNQEDLGYWFIGYNMTMTYIDPNADPNEGWDDFGTATFVDGWVLAGYVTTDEEGNKNPIIPSDYPWTVNIQKSQTDDYLYRVDCPYQAAGCPIKGGGRGYYVFSLEDPEYVLVYPGVASGAMNGSNAICGFNMEGFYLDKYGYGKDVVMQAGVLDDYSNYNEEEGLVKIYNCAFNYPSASSSAYTWNGPDGQSLEANMVTSITFIDNKPSTGIEDIITDKTDINAPAEYYNIQGMKVKNPTPGNIYIVRKGGKVSKMLVK